MPTYLLPTEEDTKIELTFADGQEPLTIDALDVDNLITDVHVKGIPEDSDFYTMYIETFKSKYKRKLSKSAVNMLLGIKSTLLETCKKKLLQQEEPLDSSEQEQPLLPGILDS